MTNLDLAAIAGVILSLVMSYIPGAKGWWDAKDSTHKRLYMGLLLVAVALIVTAIACVGSLSPLVMRCDQSDLLEFARALLAALVANQSTFVITKGGSQNGKST